jgi:hypothetical protein
MDAMSFFIELTLTPIETGGYYFIITSVKHEDWLIKKISKITFTGELESLRGNVTRITLIHVRRLGFNAKGFYLVLGAVLITMVILSWLTDTKLSISLVRLYVTFGIIYSFGLAFLWIKGNTHFKQIYHLLFDEELVCRCDA